MKHVKNLWLAISLSFAANCASTSITKIKKTSLQSGPAVVYDNTLAGQYCSHSNEGCRRYRLLFPAGQRVVAKLTSKQVPAELTVNANRKSARIITSTSGEAVFEFDADAYAAEFRVDAVHANAHNSYYRIEEYTLEIWPKPTEELDVAQLVSKEKVRQFETQKAQVNAAEEQRKTDGVVRAKMMQQKMRLCRSIESERKVYWAMKSADGVDFIFCNETKVKKTAAGKWVLISVGLDSEAYKRKTLLAGQNAVVSGQNAKILGTSESSNLARQMDGNFQSLAAEYVKKESKNEKLYFQNAAKSDVGVETKE